MADSAMIDMTEMYSNEDDTGTMEGFVELGNLISFRHYPLACADRRLDSANRSLYRVVTINWTFASVRKNGEKITDYQRVHRNVYIFTLAELIQFVRETEDVCEDVVSIERATPEEIRRTRRYRREKQ